MDTQCTLTSAEGVVDLGYGAAIADEGITFAMAGDKNTMTVGADGEGMHSLHADNSGQVTVRLLKTSPTNAKLMNIYNAQKASPKNGAKTQSHLTMQVQVITIRQKCAFKKAPDYTNAKDGSTVEWVFDSIKVDMKLGKYE
jgi:hypothetical protein